MMNRDTNGGTVLEKSRSRDRIRDVRNLTLFTLAIGGISIIVMDIVIYPVTMFAINHTKAFSVVVRYLSLFLLLSLALGLLVRRVYFLRKNGLPALKIFSMMIMAPLKNIASFFFSLFAIAMTGAIIYFLLKYNTFFLYHLSNSL